MNYNIISIPKFRKQAKKYPSLKSDLSSLFESLAIEPQQGIPIGNNCYKIRLAVKSKAKGKSGGSRVVTNIVVSEETVYLLTIYDKSDSETISDKELRELLEDIPK